MSEQGADMTANNESLPQNDEVQVDATASTSSDSKPLIEIPAESPQNSPSVPATVQPTSTESCKGQAFEALAEASDSKAVDGSRPAAESAPITSSVGESRAAPDSQASADLDSASVTKSATKADESTINEASDYEERFAKIEGQVKELQEHPLRLSSRLEDKIRAFDKLFKKVGISTTTTKENPNNEKRDYSKFCRALPRIDLMTVDEWDRRVVSLEKPHAALDVVVSSKADSDQSKHADQPMDSWGGLDLKFIQLNSIPALYAWQKIIHGTVDPDKDLSKPMVILAPFKNLTDFAEEISKAYERLEPKWGPRALTNLEATTEVRWWLSDDTAVTDNPNKEHDNAGAGEVSQHVHTEIPRNEGGTKSSDEHSLDVRRGESALLMPVDVSAKAVDGTGSTPEAFGLSSAKGDEGDHTETKSEGSMTESAAAGGTVTRPEAPSTELAATDHSEDNDSGTQEPVVAAKLQVPGSENYSQDTLNEESYDAYLGLRILLHFYQQFVEPRWKTLRSKNMEEVGEVHFSDLCELFQPGDDVYAADEPQQVWRVVRVTGGRPKLIHFLNPTSAIAEESGDDINLEGMQTEYKEASKWTPLRISGYYLDYDGRNFGPNGVSYAVDYYPGSKRIDTLKCWPLRFADEQSRVAITESGRLFFKKCQPGLHRYEGPTLSQSPSRLQLSAPPHVTSQIYVDLEKAFQLHPEWKPKFELVHANVLADQTEVSLELSDFKDRGSESNLRRWADDTVFRFQTVSFPERNASNRFLKTDRWINEDEGLKISDRSRIEPHDQILLPNRIFGLILQSREWACFNIDSTFLKESARDDTAWNELQLPESHKRSLQALIEFHFDKNRATGEQSGDSVDFDFINGKGRGLIVLLHGPPGLGKTTTAESIAMKYQKPLLPMPCGSMSIDPQTVEKSLMDSFQLAQALDAIILLDEADVFVAQRSGHDLKINAIVSVFLRALEYYTGVLFLTTNRVGQFDEALLSRISLNLYYPDLELDQTIKIWKNNLTRVLSSKLVTQGTGPNIIKWARDRFEQDKKNKQPVWNGRQIRIAFQNAVALAHLEAKESREAGDSEAKAVLKVENFEVVVDQFKDFEDYIEETRGSSFRESLKHVGVRNSSRTPSRAYNANFDTPVSSAAPAKSATASRETPPADYRDSPSRYSPFNLKNVSPRRPPKPRHLRRSPGSEDYAAELA